MPPRFLFTVVFCSAFAAGVCAAEPSSSTPNTALDQAAVDVLKDLHNRGADLYNSADAVGALRLYEGTLRAVGPFLSHRPKLQAVIANGLAEADKLDGAKAQAYRLHEVIDQVRTDLKEAMKADEEAKLKPNPERKPDPSPETTKTTSKPEPPPPPPVVGTVRGVLSLNGEAVPKADVTLVSLTLAEPRVFTAVSASDGVFSFSAGLPPATYAVMVTGGGNRLPANYQSTRTSGLEMAVKAGEQVFDLKLQSK